MSRRSERLVKKRKQSHTEYIEDLSKFGKKRKVDETRLTDVTNEVNTSEFAHSCKQLRRTASNQSFETPLDMKCDVNLPKFYLPTRLSTYSNSLRRNPLPNFNWANSSEVWKTMLSKELAPSLRRDPNIFSRHPGLDERMRSILLDWMIEVSEVYKMHRETFYMGVDYIDRYLSRTTGVKKSQLQLIGITALFIAAKMEEIYPARLADFSYVTDGACSEEDILQQEIVMLKVLNWDLSPNTAHLWLTTLYQATVSQHVSKVQRLEFQPTLTDTPKSPSSSSVQCGVTSLPDLSHLCKETSTSWCNSVAAPVTPSHEDEDNENVPESWSPCNTVCTIHNTADHSNGCPECFLSVAQFSQSEFIQIVRLLDLCVLDSGWCRFSYSTLATTVLYYCLSAESALKVSGYQWSDIEDCVNWMAVYACVIDCQDRVDLKVFSRIAPEDAHNIQTHTVSLDLLDRAAALRQSSSRLSYSENVPSDRKDSSIKLPAAFHPASQQSCLTSLVTVAVITPPNSHSRKSKHVIVAEEDSGFGVE